MVRVEQEMQNKTVQPIKKNTLTKETLSNIRKCCWLKRGNGYKKKMRKKWSWAKRRSSREPGIWNVVRRSIFSAGASPFEFARRLVVGRTNNVPRQATALVRKFPWNSSQVYLDNFQKSLTFKSCEADGGYLFEINSICAINQTNFV